MTSELTDIIVKLTFYVNHKFMNGYNIWIVLKQWVSLKVNTKALN